MMSGNAGGFGGGLGSGFGGSLAQLFGGMFGNSGKSYDAARGQFQKYLNPFFNAGKDAIGGYQDWLNGMKDPQAFYNKTMSGYQQSPMAKQQLDQTMNAGNNYASAAGLSGSTPMTQFAQQSAKDISSQDMDKYFQNMMGISNQYGGGLQNLMSGGQNSGNMLAQLMGQGAFGSQMGRQQDMNNMFGGLFSLLFGR
jgi:hypothetical protein